MKRSRLLFGFVLFLLCSLAMTSCAEKKPNKEIIVDVEMEDLLNEYSRNLNELNFVEVMEATKKVHSKKGGDFIEIFFQQAEQIIPDQRLVNFFRYMDIYELCSSSSNSEVRSYFMDKSESYMDAVESVLEARLGSENFISAQVIRGKHRIRLLIQGDLTNEELTEIIETRASLKFYEMYRASELFGV